MRLAKVCQRRDCGQMIDAPCWWCEAHRGQGLGDKAIWNHPGETPEKSATLGRAMVGTARGTDQSGDSPFAGD